MMYPKILIKYNNIIVFTCTESKRPIHFIYCTFQVFYIVLTFYGPLPGAITIERSTDSGSTFQPWQYFAEDCVASFNLQNNGPLSEPDSVNCIQYIK